MPVVQRQDYPGIVHRPNLEVSRVCRLLPRCVLPDSVTTVICLPGNTEWASGGRDLVSCYNVTRKDTSYCCEGAANCCNSGVGRFEVLPAQPYTWALWDDAKTQYDVKTPLSTAASSSTSSTISSATSSSTTSASTTSHASDQTTSSLSVSTPSSGTGTRATTETGPPGQSTTNQPLTDTVQSSGLSTGAQAGIGIGAALGALLLAAVAYLFWKLHKTKKAMGGGAGSQWQGYPQDPYSTPPPAPGSYYPQDPQQKFELHGDRGTHELQGHHYFVRGDASSAELNAQPSYSPESPVVTR